MLVCPAWLAVWQAAAVLVPVKGWYGDRQRVWDAETLFLPLLITLFASQCTCQCTLLARVVDAAVTSSADAGKRTGRQGCRL